MCTNCPGGKFSETPGGSSQSTCADCVAGTYSVLAGAGSCTSCPRNFDSPAGSTSLANCTCAAGFFSPSGGPCAPCPTGTYKNISGSAAACTPCPLPGQWSPKASAYADNCIFKGLADSEVREVQVPWYTYRLSKLQPTWGSPEFKHCELNFTFHELRQRYKELRPPIFKTGGLGPLMQHDHFEVWICIENHYCANHPTDKYFCWVLDETKARDGEIAPDQYVAWDHNANLQIVEHSK